MFLTGLVRLRPVRRNFREGGGGGNGRQGTPRGVPFGGEL